MKRLLVCIKIVILVVAIGCKRDNNLLCPDNSKTSADFAAREYTFVGFMQSDTFYQDAFSIYFKPKNSGYIKYSWKVGQELNWRTGDSLNVVFNQPFGKIDVTCAVYNAKPSVSCFPGDTGYDTVKKSIYLLPLAQNPIFGTWFGKDSSSVVAPFPINLSIDVTCQRIVIRRFPNICDTLGMIIGDLSSKGRFLMSQASCEPNFINVSRPRFNCQVSFDPEIINGIVQPSSPQNIGYLSSDKKKLSIEYYTREKQSDLTFLNRKRKFIANRL